MLRALAVFLLVVAVTGGIVVHPLLFLISILAVLVFFGGRQSLAARLVPRGPVTGPRVPSRRGHLAPRRFLPHHLKWMKWRARLTWEGRAHVSAAWPQCAAAARAQGRTPTTGSDLARPRLTHWTTFWSTISPSESSSTVPHRTLVPSG